MPYQLLAVVELIRDIPEHHLPAGARGVIVDIYGQDKYEVEFVGENEAARDKYPHFGAINQS